MGSQKCNLLLKGLVSVCFFTGCFDFTPPDERDSETYIIDSASEAGDTEVDTADTAVDTEDTENPPDTDTSVTPGKTSGVFGISSAGDRLRSENYACDLVVGRPVIGKLESENYSAILTTGTAMESLKH